MTFSTLKLSLILFGLGRLLKYTAWRYPVFRARLKERKSGYASPFEIALFYTEVGNKEQAFPWIDTAYREREFQMEGMTTDFRLDPLRSDPRFAELARRVELPQ